MKMRESTLAFFAISRFYWEGCPFTLTPEMISAAQWAHESKVNWVAADRPISVNSRKTSINIHRLASNECENYLDLEEFVRNNIF